jgi:hypothetical protein
MKTVGRPILAKMTLVGLLLTATQALAFDFARNPSYYPAPERYQSSASWINTVDYDRDYDIVAKHTYQIGEANQNFGLTVSSPLIPRPRVLNYVIQRVYYVDFADDDGYRVRCDAVVSRDRIANSFEAFYLKNCQPR